MNGEGMGVWITLFILCMAGLIILHLWWRARYGRLESDLTAQTNRVNQLQESLDQASVERLTQEKALFDNMTEGVLVLDENGFIQLINHSLLQMFDLNKDVRSQKVIEVFPLKELSDLIDRLKAERMVQGYEFQVPPGPGERFLQVNAAALLDPHGVHYGSILVFHDMTRIRVLERIRQEFVANVSHELRTPLSLIKGYVETLMDGAKNDPELATKFLQTIEKHTNRLTFLLEDILTISKLESGQIIMNLNPVEVHSEVNRVVDDLHSMILERKVNLENQVPDTLVIHADADRMQQLFFNLIENAIKYGHPEGSVKIGAKVVTDQKVEVWVQDDGPGIPLEAQEHVFERFYRVDRARSRETGGTGLGLSIVKHIVQSHGGEVWVKSEPGQGASFHFTLPRV